MSFDLKGPLDNAAMLWNPVDSLTKKQEFYLADQIQGRKPVLDGSLSWQNERVTIGFAGATQDEARSIKILSQALPTNIDVLEFDRFSRLQAFELKYLQVLVVLVERFSKADLQHISERYFNSEVASQCRYLIPAIDRSRPLHHGLGLVDSPFYLRSPFQIADLKFVISLARFRWD